ncbi:hypothetical protein [Mycobacterium sp. NPDC050853]
MTEAKGLRIKLSLRQARQRRWKVENVREAKVNAIQANGDGGAG